MLNYYKYNSLFHVRIYNVTSARPIKIFPNINNNYNTRNEKKPSKNHRGRKMKKSITRKTKNVLYN